MEIGSESDNKTKIARRERFVRVVERRTKRVLKDIVMLASCSNKNAYEYSDTDVQKIFGAIETELKKAHERFLKPDRKKGVDFTLAG